MTDRKAKIDWKSRDSAFLREKFEATRDYGYVALAIGMHPKNAEQWAWDACKAVAEEWAQITPNNLNSAHFRYAAVAIGMNLNDRPNWALEMCEKIARRSEIAHRPTLGPKRPGPYYNEDALLEKMGDILAEPGDRSVRKAARIVAEEAGQEGAMLDSVIDRLRTKWREETEETEVAENDYERFHPRLDRAFARRYAHRLIRPKRNPT